MFKLVLEKAEEPEIKLPTSSGSWKKQESYRKTSISALLTMPKPLTVWVTINWKILQEMGIPDHLICLLRNLYAGQKATVRTVHGTTDWFQIGKGVRQGCILSPAYLTYMQSTSLEKEVAAHSSVLAWRIPGTGKPGGLLSMGSHRVRHDWSNLAAAAAAVCSMGSVVWVLLY